MTIHIESVQRLAARALAAGAKQPSLGRIEWDISGRCQNPRPREVWSRGDRNARSVVCGPGLTRGQLMVVLDCKCRTCPNCLKERRFRWANRAKIEIQSSARTWFGTLTLAPQARYHTLAATRHRLDAQGVDFDQLSEQDQFSEWAMTAGREVTKYLKRIRKASKARLRYVLVSERHKDGAPHFHLLVHESFAGLTVKYRELSKHWTLGFSKWNLVTDQPAALYVTKYLAKQATTRVRASLYYGKPPELLKSEARPKTQSLTLEETWNIRPSKTPPLLSKTGFIDRLALTKLRQSKDGISDRLSDAASEGTPRLSNGVSRSSRCGETRSGRPTDQAHRKRVQPAQAANERLWPPECDHTTLTGLPNDRPKAPSKDSDLDWPNRGWRSSHRPRR